MKDVCNIAENVCEKKVGNFVDIDFVIHLIIIFQINSLQAFRRFESIN